MINYGKFRLVKKKFQTEKKVLKSQNLTQGPYVEIFEKKTL